eukprot:179547-Rhodomonas_salina.1
MELKQVRSTLDLYRDSQFCTALNSSSTPDSVLKVWSTASASGTASPSGAKYGEINCKKRQTQYKLYQNPIRFRRERARCVMCGTGVANGAVCYVIPGMDIGYRGISPLCRVRY